MYLAASVLSFFSEEISVRSTLFTPSAKPVYPLGPLSIALACFQDLRK